MLNVLIFFGRLLLGRLEYKLALGRIVDQQGNEDAHHTLGYEIVNIEALVTVDKLGKCDGASRIE